MIIINKSAFYLYEAFDAFLLYYAGRFEKSFRVDRDDLETLSFINHGHEGDSTREVLEGKKIEAIIQDNPDLIIFKIR